VQFASSLSAGAGERRTAQDEFGQRAGLSKQHDPPRAVVADRSSDHHGVLEIRHALGLERKDGEHMATPRSAAPGMKLLRQRAARQSSERRAGYARRGTFGAQTIRRVRRCIAPRSSASVR